MKIVKFMVSIFILFQCFGIILFTAPSAGAQTICNVGYSVKSMADVDPRDAEAALRVWAQEFGNQYGFIVHTSLYDSVDKMVADFVGQKLDFCAMTSIDYLRRVKTLNVKPEVAQFRNGKPTVKYLVLTGADYPKKSLAGFKNKKMSILKTNHLGLLFLNTRLMQEKMPPAEKFFSATHERSKESQAILDVFFGQSDICVVTASSYRTMKELNPQVERKLHVMAESPELVNTVGFFRSDFPPAIKERAIQGMSSEYKHHARGKQIMLLFNIEKMGLINDSQLDSVRKLLADYEKLKRKK